MPNKKQTDDTRSTFDNRTDDELANAMLVEMAAHEHPLTLVLTPHSALRLAGLLQLALRHPKLSHDNRRVAVTYVAHVREYFCEAPAIREVLRRGDDPRRDH